MRFARASRMILLTAAASSLCFHSSLTCVDAFHLTPPSSSISSRRATTTTATLPHKSSRATRCSSSSALQQSSSTSTETETPTSSPRKLQLYNSLTRTKTPLTPIASPHISMYTCGPTVYDSAHVGNFRAFLTYDILKRTLLYLGYDVDHICNLTDVDDKIINKCNAESISLQELTDKYANAFFDDLEALNIIKARAYPRATEHIEEMARVIIDLEKNGLAYQSEEGSWYFAVSKKEGYGTNLVQLDPDQLKKGASSTTGGGGAQRSASGMALDADEYDADKEGVRDFCLWKAYKPEFDREDATWDPVVEVVVDSDDDGGDEEEQQQQQNDNEQEPQYSVVKLPVMEVTHHSSSDDDDDEQNNITTKGDLCFFAGSGFDSLMLEDFKQVKAWSKSPQRSWTPSFVKDMLSSVAGYCVALVTKTLPQALLHQTHKINVKVTTTDEGTLWIDHRRGDFSELAVAVGGSSVSSVLEGGGMDRSTGEEEVSDGNNDDEVAAVTKKKKKKQQHLIYSGVTGILAASTTPFYGGGMRLFPYARLFPNKLQLRIGRISPLTGFLRIPAIFEGSYRDKSEGDFGCLDFVGNDFEVEVSSTRYEEYLKRKKESKKNTRWWSRRRKRSSNDTSSDETKKPPTGFPFQHSGESMGIKERFRVRVVKQPVKFISFLKPRIVVDD
mmetsp:Transcript_28288/g.44535  ORF Transcript_28288/g.44535 Transcript_28288/m.44535 type:complete len:672 (+) Transcript_28288:116-2131(+)